MERRSFDKKDVSFAYTSNVRVHFEAYEGAGRRVEKRIEYGGVAIPARK